MYEGKYVLFISYEMKKGSPMHEVSYYERHPDHGNLWRQTHMTIDKIRATNPSLAEEIQRWLANNNGRGFPNGGGQPW